jgi:hypothetical protein
MAPPIIWKSKVPTRRLLDIDEGDAVASSVSRAVEWTKPLVFQNRLHFKGQFSVCIKIEWTVIYTPPVINIFPYD